MDPIIFGITLNELSALLVLGVILLLFLGVLRVLLKLTVAVIRNGCLLTIGLMVLAVLFVMLN